MDILYPTSLASLVVEVGTRHSHQILLWRKGLIKFAWNSIESFLWSMMLVADKKLWTSRPQHATTCSTPHPTGRCFNISLIREQLGPVVRQPLPGLLSWYPIFKSSHCISFDDRAPVDFIYGCPSFKWVAETWKFDRAPKWYSPINGCRAICPSKVY